MLDLDSFHFDMAIEIGLETPGASIVLPVTFAGDFQSPDRIRGEITVQLGFFNIESEIVGIGETVYVKDSDTGLWDVSTDGSALLARPEEFVGVESDLLRDLELIRIEEMDGTDVYVIAGTALPGALSEGQDETDVTYWIGVRDGLLRQIVAGGDVDLEETGGGLLGGAAAGKAAVSITLAALRLRRAAVHRGPRDHAHNHADTNADGYPGAHVHPYTRSDGHADGHSHGHPNPY